MKFKHWFYGVLLAASVLPLSAEEAAVTAFPAPPFPAMAPKAEVMKTFLSKSLTDVRFHLQYDPAGNAPGALGVFCAACDTLHDSSTDELLTDRRPLRATGYYVAPGKVLVPDPGLDREGCKEITVRQGKNEVRAKIAGRYLKQGGLLLELEKELPGAEVLKFDPESKAPYYIFNRMMEEGRWIVRVNKFDGFAELQDESLGRTSWMVMANSLIVNSQGKAVALFLNNNELLELAHWNRPYTDWPLETESALVKRMEDLRKHLEGAAIPVTVYLEDAKISHAEKLVLRNQESTERESWGTVLPNGQFFTPLILTPDESGRVRKVVVWFPEGEQEVKINKVLVHFGGMVLTKPDGSPIKKPAIAEKVASLKEVMGEIVLAARVQNDGRKISVQLSDNVLGGYAKVFQDRNLLSIMKDTEQSKRPNVLFDMSGNWLGMSMVSRIFNYRGAFRMNAGDVMELLNDPAEAVEPAKIANPHNAVAFLGVETQALNAEMAQSNQVVEWTKNGEKGLLVSYVYPDSTAARLGLKEGDILLNLIVPSGGEPLEMDEENFPNFAALFGVFPWNELDKIPEAYFSELPEPWTGVRSPLNMRLTNIGIGKTAKLLAIHDHKLTEYDFKIEPAPVYYEIAPEYQARDLGLTVRDMTFELRHFFRMKPDTPGVIVADVSAGAVASTSGIRPYEIISAVDDVPVHNVAEFEKALQGKNEVRLEVRRLATSRVVSVKKQLGPRR